MLHGRDMTVLLEKPESKEVATEWNKTHTMMTYTRNTYTSNRMIEKLKAKSWFSFQFGLGANKGAPKGANPRHLDQPCYSMITDGQFKFSSRLTCSCSQPTRASPRFYSP